MKLHLTALSVLAVAASSLQAQTTIVNFSTGGTNVPGYSAGFFNSSQGWTGEVLVGTNGPSPTAPLWEGQPSTAPSWTGSGAGADFVGNVPGFSPGGAGNFSGVLGGYFAPASTPVNLNIAFDPANLTLTNVASSFVAEWSVLFNPAWGNPTLDDQFVFDLRSGGSTVLSFTNTPGGGIDYQVLTGQPGGNQNDLAFNQVYRMQVDIATNNTWSASFWNVVDPSGARTLTNQTTFSGSLVSGSAGSIDNFQVDWILASGDPAFTGATGLLVNEFTLTSTGTEIPEPGTWAVGLLLMSGVAATIYRRRKAQAESAIA